MGLSIPRNIIVTASESLAGFIFRLSCLLVYLRFNYGPWLLVQLELAVLLGPLSNPLLLSRDDLTLDIICWYSIALRYV